MERAGIPTVAVGQSRGIMGRAKYPRTLVTPFSRGQTMGGPGESTIQMKVLETALQMLSTAAAGEMRSFE